MTDNIDFPKMCGVYLLKQDGSIVIEGTNYEPSGPVRLGGNTRCRLSKEIASKYIGKMVIEISNETKVVKGTDFDNKQYIRGLLYFCGEKNNYKEAAKKMDYLSISIKDREVTVYPYIYDPEYGGYTSTKDLPNAKCSSNERDVAVTVLSTFERILEYQKS